MAKNDKAVFPKEQTVSNQYRIDDHNLNWIPVNKASWFATPCVNIWFQWGQSQKKAPIRGKGHVILKAPTIRKLNLRWCKSYLKVVLIKINLFPTQTHRLMANNLAPKNQGRINLIRKVDFDYKLENTITCLLWGELSRGRWQVKANFSYLSCCLFTSELKLLKLLLARLKCYKLYLSSWVVLLELMFVTLL